MMILRRLYCRATWPHEMLVYGFLCGYGLLNLGIFLINSHNRFATDIFSWEELGTLNAFLLGAAAALHVVFRFFRFHPGLNRPYARWLQISPWIPGNPLPAGPLHPTVQDVASIGLLTLLACWHSHAPVWLPALVAGFAYLLAFTIMLGRTGQHYYCFAAAYLWIALILPQKGDWQPVTILAALSLVVWVGHRASIRRFPWPFLTTDENNSLKPASLLDQRVGLEEPVGVKRVRQLGWPYAALSPKLQTSGVSSTNAVLLGLLGGWSYFCITTASAAPRQSTVILLCTVFAAIIRLSFYAGQCTPPFSVLGRFSSGRLIIPKYDTIFVAPCLAVLIALAGSLPVRLAGEYHRAAQAVFIALIISVLLGIGPKMQTWLLTGTHRYTGPALKGKGIVLKQI